MKKILLLLVFIQFLGTPSSAQVAQTGRFSGSVIDKSTQKPLVGVTVSLDGISGGKITDTNGLFRFTGLALRTYNITFSSVGYKPYTLYNITISAGNETYFTVELEPQASNLAEVTVKGSRKTARAASLETPLSVQRLTTEEIRSNPGGNFDISKVIQALPGVGGGQQGGGFRNDIIIRGGAPNENVFYLDGIEIPVMNHFQTQGSSGGPQGMLNVSFIEDVKLSTSAFDARYDNAMSSVFQFRQKNGNPNKLQGNIRLSATELAATFEGPASKDKKTTFLASARRSYLQLLFSALDLPIRPNFWDFQVKLNRQIDKKTTLSFIGLAAIDEFSFAPIKNADADKLYILNSNPLINQWNYTGGLILKRLVKNGYYNVALSRNSFNNNFERYEDNEAKLVSQQTLDYNSNETENKLRLDVNKTLGGWKFAYGTSLQLSEYDNHTYNVVRKSILNSAGTLVQPAIIVNYNSPLNSFWRYGAFAQISKRMLDNRLGFSAGIRTDMNSFTTHGNNVFKTLSPRFSLSYVLADNWNLNFSAGRYFKLAPYTILGFAGVNGQLINKDADYLKSDHLAAGLEYLPSDALRFTLEGFYKKYSNVPVSLLKGTSLSNMGSDFNVLGNEAVITDGKGRAYGFEFFAQKKLTERFFGILSYTFYRSEYSNRPDPLSSIMLPETLSPSSWDNRHLLSVTWGYKFRRNWELGLKLRYQGGAPYTPFNETASRLNFLSQGQGLLDYSKINTLRLNSFNSSDLRIDKKWNFKKTSLDLYLDVTNWYRAKSQASPSYSFKRTADNKGFATTDGLAMKADGSNAIPVYINNDDANFTPSIGFIIEF